MNMIEILVFAMAAFVFGMLGLMLGGPLHFLVNDKTLNIGDKAVLSIYLLPPVIILGCLTVYYLISDKPVLPAVGWGVITGMFSGIIYAYLERSYKPSIPGV